MELKPCPFCGCRLLASMTVIYTNAHHICCCQCGASGPRTDNHNYNFLWNQRKEPQPEMAIKEKKTPGEK